MLRIIALALPLIAVTEMAAAQTYKALNRQTVTATANGGFATTSSGGFGARGAWCAAADYTRTVLKKPGTTRVYVQQGAERGKNIVVFGLDPAGATPSSVFSTGASIRTPGANLSVDHAIQFCQDFRLSTGNN